MTGNALAVSGTGQPGWPTFVRLIQPNLRKIDAIDLDVEQLVEMVAANGANAVLLNGGGMVAWYPTDLPFQRVNEFLTFDYLDAALRSAHRHRLKALVRLDVTKTYQEFYEAHPDWFRKDQDGKPIAVGPLYETCMNGPFWQECNFQILDEILSRYPADGIFYNSFLYRPCQAPCEACDRALSEIAHRLGVSDTAAPAVRHTWMADFAERLRAFVASRRPGASVCMDMEVLGDDPAHSREAGWNRRLWSVQEPIVAIAFNRLTRPHPVWPHQAGENAKYLSATFPDRPACVYLTYSALFGNRRLAQPPYQLAHDMIQVAANGTGVALQLPGTFKQDDRRALSAVKEMFRFLADNETIYTRARSAARVSLVYSQATADTYARSDPVGRFLDEYCGWYEALVESHVPFDVIDDDFLEGGALARYEVTVLPNVAAMAEEACRRVDDYVFHGGAVVASYESSLFTADGTMRDDFGLRAIGRRFERTIAAPGSYLLIKDHQMTPGLGDTDLIGLGAETHRGGFGPLAFGGVSEIDQDSVREAEMVFTSALNDVERQVDFFWIPPVVNNIPEFSYWDRVSGKPGLVVGRHGAGRIVYMPWMPGRLMHRYAIPRMAELMGNLVEEGVKTVDIEVEGPKSIEVTLHRLEPGGWLIHFLNTTGLYTPSRELVPVGPVRLRLLADGHQARSLRTGELIDLRAEAGGVSFTIPKVECFEAVTIE